MQGNNQGNRPGMRMMGFPPNMGGNNRGNRGNTNNGNNNRRNNNTQNNNNNNRGNNGNNNRNNGMNMNMNMMSNLLGGFPFGGMNMKQPNMNAMNMNPMNMFSMNDIASKLFEGNGMGDLFTTLTNMQSMNVKGRNKQSNQNAQNNQTPPSKKSPEKSFPADLIDRGSFYELRAQLPGYEKNELDVEVGDTSVSITAIHKENPIDDQSNYLSQECSKGTLTRTFELSEISKAESEATFQDGVLYMKLPKLILDPLKKHKLEIK